MAGANEVHAGRVDEGRGDLDGMDLAALFGADVVLDAHHALDLALDLGAVPLGLGDDLDRLARVLGDVELGAVEQHRVPAGLEAGRDPLAVRAVVQVQRHRHGHRVGAGTPDRRELAGTEGLHGLQRRLDDQRRLEVRRRGQDGLQREVVDDVDRGDAVALREGAIEDLPHRHHRHKPDASNSWALAPNRAVHMPRRSFARKCMLTVSAHLRYRRLDGAGRPDSARDLRAHRRAAQRSGRAGRRAAREPARGLPAPARAQGRRTRARPAGGQRAASTRSIRTGSPSSARSSTASGTRHSRTTSDVKDEEDA